MFSPSSRVRIYVCVEAVSTHKSFSGLSGAVRSILKEDPLSGHAFLFFNRKRTYVKVLWWDRTGYCIVSKRLTRGTFGGATKEWLTVAELSQVLEGRELVVTKKHYEYLPQ